MAQRRAIAMGADLYIKKLHIQKNNNRYSAKAYFRDSYNMSNVLWTLNLSWWRDVLPLLDEGQELKGENLRNFRGRIVDAQQRLPTAKELRENHVLVSKAGENSIGNWHHHYTKKRKELVDFLDRAIENHSSVICSL